MVSGHGVDRQIIEKLSPAVVMMEERNALSFELSLIRLHEHNSPIKGDAWTGVASQNLAEQDPLQRTNVGPTCLTA